MLLKGKAEMVLSVFIDGLKFSSLKHMPFLNSFGYKQRVATDLGYSITCHATMYTGVRPDKHKFWFSWKYQPRTSPFRWVPDNRMMELINILPVRLFVGKTTRLFSSNTSYGGLSTMKCSALRNWRYFDLAESKLWNEEGYSTEYPTVFDIMRENNTVFQCVGLTRAGQNGGSLKHLQEYNIPENPAKWTYLFVGEVDEISHFHGQESEEALRTLRRTDAAIERIYNVLKKKIGRDPYFMCWSDHGHMMIREKIDLYGFFARRSVKLDRIIHIVDTNFARFWFRNDKERELVTAVLKEIPSGFIMKKEHLRKYRTEMPDRRYGDIIYYLDHPYMFKKTVWGYGLRTRSIHGYLPDYPEKDGAFVSNTAVKEGISMGLVDILPSLLSLLGMKPQEHFDGRSVWA